MIHARINTEIYFRIRYSNNANFCMLRIHFVSTSSFGSLQADQTYEWSLETWNSGAIPAFPLKHVKKGRYFMVLTVPYMCLSLPLSLEPSYVALLSYQVTFFLHLIFFFYLKECRIYIWHETETSVQKYTISPSGCKDYRPLRWQNQFRSNRVQWFVLQ